MSKIFHHNDHDGRCAAAIAWRAMPINRDPECQLIEIDYKDPVPVDSIQPGELVVIVDFSFKPEVMKLVLEKTENVVWIDHHETAMQYRYGVELAGMRNPKYSGCELAWFYYHKDFKAPTCVQLIGDRDRWANRYGEIGAQFNEALKTVNLDPVNEIWDMLFNDHLHGLFEKGKTILSYWEKYSALCRKSFGHEVILDGLVCYALNLYTFGADAFGKFLEQYDACIAYAHDGAKWHVSLYSKKRDIKDIAVKYGGGGHPYAAGFTCDTLPFTKL